MSGVPQTRMYEILSGLEERKLVTKMQARTAMFKATPLNVILEQFRAERIEEVRKASVATKFLGELLGSLEGLTEQFEGQFRIFETPVRRRWDK
jgi:sugar-specific transcriptional regulator TrmB